MIVAAIGAIAVRTGIYIVSDEIYEDIVFDGARHVSFLEHTPPIGVRHRRRVEVLCDDRLAARLADCPPTAAPIAVKLQEPVVSPVRRRRRRWQPRRRLPGPQTW